LSITIRKSGLWEGEMGVGAGGVRSGRRASPPTLNKLITAASLKRVSLNLRIAATILVRIDVNTMKR
jgi:hypothetical protein